MAYYYCTPEDVAKVLDIPDPSNNLGYYTFSEHSHPSYDVVKDMIESNESIIDRNIQDSWKMNVVKNATFTIPSYWHDENAVRSDYYAYGGNKIQLMPEMCQFDPTMGDKVEIRGYNNLWIDITDQFLGDNEAGASKGGRTRGSFWFDYPRGAMYIGKPCLINGANGLRISYRYGKIDPVPKAIRRLCILMTARGILANQLYNIKVGSGGDGASNLKSCIDAWKEEEGMIWRTFQTAGAVISLYR